MLLITMNFDLIVIGSGPGGQKAALQGAKAGKKVAIIEEYAAIGGGCVHFGTLPSKSFRESVYRWSLGSRGTLGQSSVGTNGAEKEIPTKRIKDLPDMRRLLKRKERVVSDEARIIFDQLKRNAITILHGKARIKSANEVLVVSPKGKKTITGKFIVVATGARPVSPAHLAIDGKRVVDSNTVLDLKKLPKSMVVLGAGIIGCEYASMFGMAGTKVHLIDRRHEMLASVDREIVSHLTERFLSLKMDIILKVEATKLERLKTGVRVHLSDGRKLTVDTVLVTLGRCGNTEGLGLQEVGVEMDERGLVKVDKSYRTNVPNIFAVGDVVGMPALASTSMEQGRIACCNAFGLERSEMSPLFPYGIYTIPEISMVGPTEEELVAKKAEFVIGRARYRELARGQIVGDRWGLLKLIVDKKTLKLLAVHIIGDNAAELVHIGQSVMAFDGDVKYFIRTVFNYPTLAEAYKTAAFHAVNQIRTSNQPA